MDSLAASPTDRLSSIQYQPATPVAYYTDVTARCWCESTITLRTDGYWWHGAKQGVYCREVAS